MGFKVPLVEGFWRCLPLFGRVSNIASSLCSNQHSHVHVPDCFLPCNLSNVYQEVLSSSSCGGGVCCLFIPFICLGIGFLRFWSVVVFKQGRQWRVSSTIPSSEAGSDIMLTGGRLLLLMSIVLNSHIPHILVTRRSKVK
ncbi:uncharacterized protein G2W53_018207 [Senna tora]|uniref:Uncharacterized protein n=1 Tax=Senna tora TaxID=362788 RepID=A0A834WN48_9FABA|nr:uncharacterized protein G2W53_018207 [Senna tora]